MMPRSVRYAETRGTILTGRLKGRRPPAAFLHAAQSWDDSLRLIRTIIPQEDVWVDDNVQVTSPNKIPPDLFVLQEPTLHMIS